MIIPSFSLTIKFTSFLFLSKIVNKKWSSKWLKSPLRKQVLLFGFCACNVWGSVLSLLLSDITSVFVCSKCWKTYASGVHIMNFSKTTNHDTLFPACPSFIYCTFCSPKCYYSDVGTKLSSGILTSFERCPRGTNVDLVFESSPRTR